MKTGTVVLVKKDFPFLQIKAGELGVVFKTYKDFDIPVKNGGSIIFENGGHDDWSVHDQGEYLTVIGHEEKHENYTFNNISQLMLDYKKGIWDFKALNKKFCKTI